MTTMRGSARTSIKRRGGDALGIVCDVTDEAQVEAMVARARETRTAASTCS